MRLHEKEIFEIACGRFGVGAFNVFNAEQAKGVMLGARRSGRPVIVQITPVAREYLSPAFIKGLLDACENDFPDVRFSVHLDHGNRAHCIAAIEEDVYSSVMIDASHEPFDVNVAMTKEIVSLAHAKGIRVEAELGVLSGVEDHLSVGDDRARYTDPAMVAEFVSLTGCDSLAVAVGTSHGAYKFSGGRGLRTDILAEIRDQLPKNYPLVLHGASAVPENEIRRINLAGGTLKTEAKGIAPEQLAEAIKLGVAKINIATDLRLIWTRVVREFFRNNPEQFDPVTVGKIYISEIEDFVAQKCLSL